MIKPLVAENSDHQHLIEVSDNHELALAGICCLGDSISGNENHPGKNVMLTGACSLCGGEFGYLFCPVCDYCCGC